MLENQSYIFFYVQNVVNFSGEDEKSEKKLEKLPILDVFDLDSIRST